MTWKPAWNAITCKEYPFEIPKVCPHCGADLTRTDKRMIEEISLDYMSQSGNWDAIHRTGEEDDWACGEHFGDEITLGWACTACHKDLVSPSVETVTPDPSNDPFRRRAMEKYGEEGRIEFDDDAKVSVSVTGEGAYVQAWVWVEKGE